MQNCEKSILNAIYKYINEDLDKLIEDTIFSVNSKAALGEAYYGYIISSINGSDRDSINKVVSVLGLKDSYQTQEEFYKELVEIIGYKKMPYEILATVRVKFDDIFTIKRNAVNGKYQAEIRRINEALWENKTNSDSIKNKAAAKSFVHDISADEESLYELSSECNALRTRKEMVEYVMHFVESSLREVCNFDDLSDVEKTVRLTTLSMCKEENEGIRDLYFKKYDDYLDILEYDIDNPNAIFYKIKLLAFHDELRERVSLLTYKSDENCIRQCEEIKEKIPTISYMESKKKSNKDDYLELLDKILTVFTVHDKIIELIQDSPCLRDRKSVLLQAIDLVKNENYELFINIIPIQIEGIFADYLRDSTIFKRFLNINIYENAVLKDKIQNIEIAGDIMYPEAIEYYKFYFNNMIRNRIAHGRYLSSTPKEDEIFSKELLLDLYQLIRMITRTSEIEKMYRFVHGYRRYYERLSSSENPIYGALFNDMIGSKMVAAYDSIENYRPIQVVYWLLNPYYEKIYEQVGDKEELLDLRAELLSKEFWEYVLEKVRTVKNSGYDYLRINHEFLAVVRGMFNCGVSDDTKRVLANINSVMKEIQSFEW